MDSNCSANQYVIDPPLLPSLAVVGSEMRFPVHRIYCVGRNFADHAVEMGHDPSKDPPFFFLKSGDCILPEGERFNYPALSQNVHHEVELVVALKHGGADIATNDAADCIFGYAVGLDMTRRDMQDEAKKLSRPWDTSKGFDQSAPCSAIYPVSQVGHPTEGRITLDVNRAQRQSGDLNQMIWKVPEIIAHLSRLFTLVPGDLIYTGTPAGVGVVQRGDVLVASVAGLGEFTVEIA